MKPQLLECDGQRMGNKQSRYPLLQPAAATGVGEWGGGAGASVTSVTNFRRLCLIISQSVADDDSGCCR